MNSSDTIVHQSVPVSNQRDEGVIKFHAKWHKTSPFPQANLLGLIHTHHDLFQQGLVGKDEDGVSYGNISQRIDRAGRFYITGSGTGCLPEIDGSHISRVEEVDVGTNQITCSGPMVASSESMTHSVIYQQSSATGGIVHVHSHNLWQYLRNSVPTTPPEVEYGTPAMALAVTDLFQKSDLDKKRILVMAGHEDGVFAFGSDLSAAIEVLMKWLVDVSD